MEGRSVTAPMGGRLLIIGIGSRLMRDDGIGPRIADALLQDASSPRREVLAAETDFGCAMDLLRPGDHVVLIDAVQSGAAPGSVRVFPFRQGREGPLFSQHEACMWHQALRNQGADCLLIGVEAADVSVGLTLSPALSALFPKICKDVTELLEAIEEACAIGLA